MERSRLAFPPQELRFMNETDKMFVEIGDSNLSLLIGSGFGVHHSMLDVGCGYGRLAYALHRSFPDFSGRYYGFDILTKHISWCQKEFKELSNYKFDHIDIKNDRYNPKGGQFANHFEFEMENQVDFVAVFSVFTHMHQRNIEAYLNQIANVLSAQGIAVCTFFTFNPKVLDKVNSRDQGLSFQHKLSDAVYYHNITDPLHAIAFDRVYLFDLIESIGMKMEKFIPGHWSGMKSPHYQDVVILRNSK